MDFDGDDNNEINNLLLSTVRQGDRKALQNHLSLIKNPEIYLNHLYDEAHNQKCTLLMIACLNKHEDIVRLLLDYDNVNIEILNDIQLLEKDQNLWMFEDVTILWAAAAIDNFSIVKLLVEYGAQINHTTKTNSTALRCACCNGNIDMARYLIKNGADIHINKIHNETNLIACVFNKDSKMTTYLLDELGVDVNDCIDDNRSPLYIAADRGLLELVQILLDHGARNFRATHDQMSPLLLAAEKRRSDIVNLISSQCSLLEQIEAEELLGSAFICEEHGARDLEKSLEYFHKALELRSKYNFPKVLRSSTVEAFNYRQECQTIDQLKELQLNPENIYIEALLIRERLLGPTNAKYRHSLRYRGAVLADFGQHTLGMVFWLYELELRRQYSISADIDDLRQWASIFSDTIRTSPLIPIVAWQTVFTVIIEELDNHNKIDFDFNLHTLLFLITVVSQILSKTVIANVDRQIFYRHIYLAVQRQYVTQSVGSSLLHLCLNENTTADDYFIDYNCLYPCLNTACILLQCGADVNAMDSVRNTPLHIFVSNSNITDNSIVQLLDDFGAHLDCANALGELPIDIVSNPNIKQFLKTKTELSLKCLCAKLIQRNGIPFHGKFGTSLIKFIEKH